MRAMRVWTARLRELLRDEAGPTATEYAVMLAAMVLVCVGAIGAVGSRVSEMFTEFEAAW